MKELNSDVNNPSKKKHNKTDKKDDFELENLEKQQKEKEDKQILMVYKDFYEINYQEIHNFHKKV